VLACRGESFTVARYHSWEMLKCSKELIESGEFDVVHVAFYYMAQYAFSGRIRVPGKTAVVLDAHLVEHLFYSRAAELSRNPFIKLLMRIESLRVKKYEASVYKKFDRCIAVSELDMENMIKISNAANIVVISHFVETPDAGQGAPFTQEDEKGILFFGSLKYPANDDAVRFFYRDILPLIKKEIPDVRFLIAGRSASGYVAGLSVDPCVRYMGFVPDIKDLLRTVALVVVPLRLGGGIRIKILESWAMAKAVVSTTIGAEGVRVKDGEDIIIADSAADFANAVIMLLRDKSERERIGRAAFQKVREYYSPEKKVENLERIYKEALQEKMAG